MIVFTRLTLPRWPRGKIAFALRDLLALTVATGWWLSPAAIAQVIPDGTLNSRVTGTCLLNNCTISGGTREGDNLFHSFLSFNIWGGREATFAHDPDVSRIFGRLNTLLNTAAFIDGKLKTNGASLFLLSPGGIIFGPQSQLDVGTIFVGTSANQMLKTGSGQFGLEPFGQANLQELFSGAPDTFHFDRSPGTIRLIGNGSSPVFNPNSGGTIALIGGPVQIENRTIFLPQQQLFLGGFGEKDSQAQMSGNQFSLGSGSPSALESVSISGSLMVANGANFNGEIKIEARGFSLLDSSISSHTNTTGNSIQIISSEDLTLTNSSIKAQVQNTDTQNQIGNLLLSGKRLKLTNSSISTESLGLGGNINLTMDDIELTEASQILTRGAAGSSFSGNIEINAENLDLNSFSSITTETSAFGGNLAIQLGKELKLNQSTLIQTRAGQPEGGYLSILADELKTDAQDDADIIALGPRNNLSLSYDKISGFIPSSPPQRNNRLSEIGYASTSATTLPPESNPPTPPAPPANTETFNGPSSVVSLAGGLSTLQNAIQNAIQDSSSGPIFSDLTDSANPVTSNLGDPRTVQARSRQAGEEVREHCRSDASQGHLSLRLSGRGGLPPVPGLLQAQTPLVDLGTPPQGTVLESLEVSEPTQNWAGDQPPQTVDSIAEASHWKRLRDGRVQLLGAESVAMHWQQCQG